MRSNCEVACVSTSDAAASSLGFRRDAWTSSALFYLVYEKAGSKHLQRLLEDIQVQPDSHPTTRALEQLMPRLDPTVAIDAKALSASASVGRDMFHQDKRGETLADFQGSLGVELTKTAYRSWESVHVSIRSASQLRSKREEKCLARDPRRRQAAEPVLAWASVQLDLKYSADGRGPHYCVLVGAYQVHPHDCVVQYRVLSEAVR